MSIAHLKTNKKQIINASRVTPSIMAAVIITTPLISLADSGCLAMFSTLDLAIKLIPHAPIDTEPMVPIIATMNGMDLSHIMTPIDYISPTPLHFRELSLRQSKTESG